MKKLIVLASILATGCATTHVYDSPPQSYRPSGQDKSVSVTGRMEQLSGESVLHVFFDGDEVLTGKLNRNATGEIIGQAWHDAQISASCTTRPVSRDWAETRCMIFHGNERTATLTF